VGGLRVSMAIGILPVPRSSGFMIRFCGRPDLVLDLLPSAR
jgi:hypothetical protein